MGPQVIVCYFTETAILMFLAKIFENLCQNLKQRLNFLRRYHSRGASCTTGTAPDFYVEDRFIIDI